MSAEATAWAWNQKVEKNAKLLLPFLADGANRYGRGPRAVIEDASRVCGMGTQTVNKHLSHFQEKTTDDA